MRMGINGLSLCMALQWIVTAVSVVTGIVVMLKGDPEVGIGIMLAAFSSAKTITNNLERCDRRKEDGP